MVSDEKSAGAVIFLRDGDKPTFLLLHYTSGHWDFPKGNIEKGESEKQAAIREVREETGISDMQLVDGFRQVVEYKYRHGRRLVSKEVVLFLAQTKTTRVILSDEHVDYACLDYDGAIQKLTYPNARTILEAALKHLDGKKPASI